MIRPNLIGNLPHFPRNSTETRDPTMDPWQSLYTSFGSNVLTAGEYQPGVYSTTIAYPVDKSMANMKMDAFHFRVPMVPDDSRPGYPFVVSVTHQYHLSLDPTKAYVHVDPIMAFAKYTAQYTDTLKVCTALPNDENVSDGDNFIVQGHGATTFTAALPPQYEHEKGWYLCLGFAVRTHDGAASMRTSQFQMQASVLYQNRPAYDPNMA